MADQDVRELERRWKQTGLLADEAAWLGARVRAGEVSPSHLHLAAFLGDPAALQVYEPPSEPDIQAAIPAARWEGIKEAVDANWKDYFERAEQESLRPAGRLLLRLAAEEPNLRRLLPLFSNVTLFFSQGMTSPWTTGIAIHPSDKDEDSSFTVRFFEDTLLETDDAQVAIRAAADWYGSDAPLWQGDRHDLPGDRARAGAIDELVFEEDRLAVMRSWGPEAVARGAFAMARHVYPHWVPVRVGDEDPARDGLDAMRTWLACPCDRHAGQVRTHAARLRRWRDLDWGHDNLANALIVGKLINTFPRCFDDEPYPGILIGGPPRTIDRAELKQVVREAVIPWALGLGDPVLD